MDKTLLRNLFSGGGASTLSGDGGGARVGRIGGRLMFGVDHTEDGGRKKCRSAKARDRWFDLFSDEHHLEQVEARCMSARFHLPQLLKH